jgi:hypothetical protein
VKLGGADWDKSILYCPDCAWNNIEIDSNDSRIAELESENKRLRKMVDELAGLREWMSVDYTIDDYKAFCKDGTLPEEK